MMLKIKSWFQWFRSTDTTIKKISNVWFYNSNLLVIWGCFWRGPVEGSVVSRWRGRPFGQLCMLSIDLQVWPLVQCRPKCHNLIFRKFRLSSSVSSSQILLMVTEIQHQIAPAEKIRCHWDKKVSTSWAPDTTKTQLGSTPGFVLP